MSSNGTNAWGVSFSRISFLQSMLTTHKNIAALDRHDDIIFEAVRVKQNDQLTIACVDAYAAGMEIVMRVLAAFPAANVIYVGGKWNGYTSEALEFCKERNIGIFHGPEIIPALFQDDFWNYDKLDAEGNSMRGRPG